VLGLGPGLSFVCRRERALRHRQSRTRQICDGGDCGDDGSCGRPRQSGLLHRAQEPCFLQTVQAVQNVQTVLTVLTAQTVQIVQNVQTVQGFSLLPKY